MDRAAFVALVRDHRGDWTADEVRGYLDSINHDHAALLDLLWEQIPPYELAMAHDERKHRVWPVGASRDIGFVVEELSSGCWRAEARWTPMTGATYNYTYAGGTDEGQLAAVLLVFAGHFRNLLKAADMAALPGGRRG